MAVATKTEWLEGTIVSLDDLMTEKRHADKLFLPPRRRVLTHAAGAARSPFKGRGMEFEEVRIYQEGDDIRTIDWRVTARTGKTHTKLYQEERERPVLFLVDNRPHMRFGTKNMFKSVLAAKATSALAWAAKERGDRIGGSVISASRKSTFRPQRTRANMLAFLQALADATADSGEDKKLSLDNSLAEFRRIAQSGGQIFVVSDFKDFSHETKRHLSKLSNHCDVVCVMPFDPLEITPPPPGFYKVTNGEDFYSFDASDKDWRKNYSIEFENKFNDLLHFFRSKNIRFIPLSTAKDYARELRVGLFDKSSNVKIFDNKEPLS